MPYVPWCVSTEKLLNSLFAMWGGVKVAVHVIWKWFFFCTVKAFFSFTMTSSKFEHVSTNTEQQSETSTGYSDGELRRGTTLYQRPRVQPVRKMRHDVIFRTCVITMIHRNVQPHVSMKWQRELATDSRGHGWGAPTPISVLELTKNEVDEGSLSRTCSSEFHPKPLSARAIIPT